MNTDEIKTAMANVPGFAGVFARDKLPYRTRRPAGIVINHDRAAQPGSHWVAYFITTEGEGEYFDPLGQPIPNNEILAFVKRNGGKKWGTSWNNIPYQSESSVKCGHFCIFFLKRRLSGKSACEIHALLSQNPDVNDRAVSNVRDRGF